MSSTPIWPGAATTPLHPWDDKQSRHARPSRPTGRTTVAPRFPHTSPLRSVWIGRHSRRSPLTMRGSAFRSISIRPCESSERPSSTTREKRAKDGSRRISKPERIVVTFGPRIPCLSGQIFCALRSLEQVIAAYHREKRHQAFRRSILDFIQQNRSEG